jgi:hypothetical protein
MLKWGFFKEKLLKTNPVSPPGQYIGKHWPAGVFLREDPV